MTGGIVPLAATVTTEAVFEAFQSDSKVYLECVSLCLGLSNLNPSFLMLCEQGLQ